MTVNHELKSNLCVLFARGGSKGFTDKNLALFKGSPLISHSIRQVLEIEGIKEVIVSTDSEVIAKIAEESGGKVYFLRPKELATDFSPEWESWQHSISFMEKFHKKIFETFMTFPITSPLRKSSDILEAINQFYSENNDILISGCIAKKNPYFNMIELDSSKRARLVKIPSDSVTSRQSAPVVYENNNAIYIAKRDFVMSKKNIYDGDVGLYVMPENRSIDIDTSLDLQVAELIARSGERNENDN
jgi:hypothetical protein